MDLHSEAVKLFLSNKVNILGVTDYPLNLGDCFI